MDLIREWSYVEQTNWHTCQGCGYEREGSEAPANCPHCGKLEFKTETIELKWS